MCGVDLLSDQQIFTFSLHQRHDSELIYTLNARKNRSSFIRRAINYFIDQDVHQESFDKLYADYERTVKLYRMLWEQHKDEKCNFIAKTKSQYKD